MKERLLKIIFLPFVCIIRLLSSILYIRVSPFKVARIGHLVAEAEIFLCKKKIKKKMIPITIDFFFQRKKEKPCNNFFFNIVKSKINFIPRFIGHYIYNCNVSLNKRINSKKKYYILLNDRYDPNFFKIDNQQLKLSEKNQIKGDNLARKLRITRNDKYVCLICRDEKYLKNFDKNFDYHSYRNANVNSFIPTCDYLISKGFKIIRMGNVASEKIKFNHKNFVDYPFSEHVSEILDIYYLYNCNFVLTNGTGLDEVAALSRKPFVQSCVAPIGTLNHRANKDFLIFKKYFSKIKNRELFLSEIFQNHSAFYHRSDLFEQNGIKLINNTPEEIFDLTVECVNYLDKKENSDNKSKLEMHLQDKFWKIYNNGRQNTPNNMSMFKTSYDLGITIGSKFLVKNKDLIK